MTNVIAGSHSAYETFATCPRMYQAKHVTKEVQFTQGPEAIWGDAVHLALELYIKRGTPLPPNMQQYLPFAKAIASRPGVVHAEAKLAVNIKREPVGYFDRGVWLRSKVDVTVINGSVAEIFDWKTGKRKDDITQLNLYAASTMALHASVEVVKAGYVWLKDRAVSKPVIFKREDLDKMWAKWEEKRQLIARAHEVDHFPPKPSGLCNGWCDVTACKFWKPKREQR